MLAKAITYNDFNDNHVRTETFYFHVSETELTMLNFEIPGGLQAYFQQIVQAENNYELAKLFMKLIDLSYGVKSLDGKHFTKNEEELAKFKGTDAYNKLFMELVNSDEAAVEFIKGILPSEMSKAINEEEAKRLVAETVAPSVIPITPDTK